MTILSSVIYRGLVAQAIDVWIGFGVNEELCNCKIDGFSSRMQSSVLAFEWSIDICFGISIREDSQLIRLSSNGKASVIQQCMAPF